ncbi:hypothetical protein STAS_27020, partial [Striga asiatica]
VQDKHSPSQSASQDPKTKRCKLSKGNESNAKKAKLLSKKDTGPKPVLEQPNSFAGNSDTSSVVTYLLSIFPEGETSSWKDSQTQASVTMFNLVKVSSSPRPTHAKESKLVSLRVYMDQRIAQARSDGETSFISSVFGTRFLEYYSIELLKYFEHTTAFLGKLGPACIQYFQVGVERTIARDREQGFICSADETAILTGLPDPVGWNGNKSQPADQPWWTPVLDVAKKKAELASDDEEEEGDQEESP